MKKIFFVLFILGFPVLVSAQIRHTFSEKGNAVKHKSGLPPWAKAQHYHARNFAYFPDYYTFYDPKRKGYYYWNNDKYIFTPALPPFLEKVDMRKSRIRILKGLSLDLHPELHYPYYMKLYPAVPGNSLVPVPIPGNPAAH